MSHSRMCRRVGWYEAIPSCPFPSSRPRRAESQARRRELRFYAASANLSSSSNDLRPWYIFTGPPGDAIMSNSAQALVFIEHASDYHGIGGLTAPGAPALG